MSIMNSEFQPAESITGSRILGGQFPLRDFFDKHLLDYLIGLNEVAYLKETYQLNKVILL